MTRVAIIEGVRTPFTKAGSALASVPAQELGRVAVRELIERTELDPASIDEVIIGNVAQPAEAANIARVIALTAGMPASVSAQTVARNCASGLQAVASAFELIQAGRAHTVVAGGTESMSNIPLLFPKEMGDYLGKISAARSWLSKLSAATRFRPRMLKPVVALAQGLTDPFCGLNMGETAEVLAKEFRISRREQDAFALLSHQRAAHAAAAGRFAAEIAPVYAEKGPVEKDIGPRSGQTMEALAKLNPYFDKRHGTVTVGNSCPITDGAAALLLMSEERAQASGLRPIAWIRSYGFAGLDPKRMGLGPAFASALALRRAGLSMRDIGLVEINEAFAAQVLAVLRLFEKPDLAETFGGRLPELGPVDPENLNVNGGAIALGHPVGASGARLALTLAKEMEIRGAGFGLASLCIGGGQGAAVVLERAS